MAWSRGPSRGGHGPTGWRSGTAPAAAIQTRRFVEWRRAVPAGVPLERVRHPRTRPAEDGAHGIRSHSHAPTTPYGRTGQHARVKVRCEGGAHPRPQAGTSRVVHEMPENWTIQSVMALAASTAVCWSYFNARILQFM